MYRCTLKQESNPLLTLCKNKVLSGSPSTPTIMSNRISLTRGGAVTEGRKVFFYIEATVSVNMNAPAGTNIGEWTLLYGLPIPYSSGSYSGCSCVFEINDSAYVMVLKNYNSSGSIAFYLDNTDASVVSGNKVVTYGYYKSAS